MKIQVRTGVFETNSSSTHAICIAKEPVDFDGTIKTITFNIGEFGWELDKLDTPNIKASYLYTAIYSLYYDEEIKESLEFIKQTLESVGIEAIFNTPKFINYDNGDKYLSGYIDHVNKADTLLKALLSDRDRLLSFLLSSKSFIATGNDNDNQSVSIKVNYEHEEYYKGN